jgi:hypothetical protein
MLALGASHLSVTTSESNLQTQALIHRGEAVKLLNNALSLPAKNHAESDARFAAFMILTFQSSCMSDGLLDFLTMLRGCFLQNIMNDDSAFKSFVLNRHMERMDRRLKGLHPPPLDMEVLDDAAYSLKAIRPLCQHEVEITMHDTLSQLISCGYESPKEGTCARDFPQRNLK